MRICILTVIFCVFPALAWATPPVATAHLAGTQQPAQRSVVPAKSSPTPTVHESPVVRTNCDCMPKLETASVAESNDSTFEAIGKWWVVSSITAGILAVAVISVSVLSGSGSRSSGSSSNLSPDDLRALGALGFILL